MFRFSQFYVWLEEIFIFWDFRKSEEIGREANTSVPLPHAVVVPTYHELKCTDRNPIRFVDEISSVVSNCDCAPFERASFR
jgi:hypothetical protein